MKSIIALIIIFSFFTSPGFSQNVLERNQKQAAVCKVWGFLKYYHPEVAKGKGDWDAALIHMLERAEKVRDREAFSMEIKWLLDSLGKVNLCKKCAKSTVPDSLKFNFDNNWREDSILFTDEIRARLHYIETNRNTGPNYYVIVKNKRINNPWFENEKVYPDSVFPSSNFRLLTLFRFWNMVHYFSPYKYVSGENWNAVLIEMIPEFRDATDTVSYHASILKLTAKLHDTHTGYFSKYARKFLGTMSVPFTTQIIGYRPVVRLLLNDSIAALYDIKKGDVVLSVNGTTVEELIKERTPYVGASNEAALMRNLGVPYWSILSGETKEVTITFEREGKVSEKIIGRFPFEVFKYNRKDQGKPWKVMENNIGYVNMGLLKPDEVEPMMAELVGTKTIIFDQRNYPNQTLYLLVPYFTKTREPFARFTYPDLSYPGMFIWEQQPAWVFPSRKKKHYEGKVVILVDEHTQSQAEFTVMALQKAASATIIGSQTAGADGNFSKFLLPGGGITGITGIGVYYPDGRPTQRIGIVPDIEVYSTIQGIRLNKDEVLERALEFLRSGR